MQKKHLLALCVAVFLVIVSISFSSAIADIDITYNFNSTFEDSKSFADGCGAPSLPPPTALNDTCSFPGTYYNTLTTDAGLDSSDNTDANFIPLASNSYTWHRFWFNTSDFARGDMRSVNFTWEGSWYNGRNVTFYVWNYSDSSWLELRNITALPGNQDFVDNTFRTDINDTVNETDGMIYFMAFGRIGVSFARLYTDLAQLRILGDFFLIDNLVDDQEIFNTLTYTLNTTADGYNDTIWYTVDGGTTNETICEDTNECSGTVTFPNQGYFNMTVYANKSDSTEITRDIQNLFVANQTSFNFTDNTRAVNASSCSFSTANNNFRFDNPPNVLPPSCIFGFSDDTTDSDLDSSDDQWLSINPGLDHDPYFYFVYNSSLFEDKTITNMTFEWEGKTSWSAGTSFYYHVYNHTAGDWLQMDSGAVGQNVDGIFSGNFVANYLDLINNEEIHTIVSDLQSNAETISTDYTEMVVTYFTPLVDATDPVVSIFFPANTSYNFNVSQINYTVIELNEDSCWYSTDGGTTNSSSVVSGTDFQDVISTESLNTWTVYCNDTAGNEGQDVVSFTRDETQPATTLDSPADATENSDGNVNFSYSVTDTNNIANCSLVVGGSILETDTSVTKSITQYFNITGLSNGQRNWYVNCTDVAGNINQSESRSINLNLDVGGGGGGGPLPDEDGDDGDLGDDEVLPTEPDPDDVPNEGAIDENNDGDYTDPNDDYDGDGIINAEDETPWGDSNEELIDFLTVGASSGGGAPSIVEKNFIAVLAVKQPSDVGNLSFLSRAKLFKVLFTFCGGSNLEAELNDCSLTQTDLDEINDILRNDYLVDIEPSETISWIRNYNNDEVEAVNVILAEAELWGLISRELTIIEPIFAVSPVFFDKFFLTFSNQFTGKVTSNKVLSSLEIIEADAGITADITTLSTAEVTYVLPPSQGIKFSTVEGKISYIDIDGNVVVQNVRIRIIPWQVVLIALGVLGIGAFIFRKRIVRAFKKARK